MYAAWTKLHALMTSKAYLVSSLPHKCTLLPSSVLHCPAPFLMTKQESCLLESSSPASTCPWTHLTYLWFHCLASVMCVSPPDHVLLTSMVYSPIVSTDMLTSQQYQQMLAKPGYFSVRYLWLFADGLHKNIITIRIIEKRKLQNASSTQISIQS